MLTRFEKARVLGARSLQIAMGAPILIKTTSTLNDPYEIAQKEFEAQVLPITVIRMAPNGEEIKLDLKWFNGKTEEQNIEGQGKAALWDLPREI